jgi:hypothetical protein
VLDIINSQMGRVLIQRNQERQRVVALAYEIAKQLESFREGISNRLEI